MLWSVFLIGRVLPVEQAVPLIYTREILPPPMRAWMRLLAAAVALGALTMLVIGAYLTPGGPTGSGISTHTQLGLQACQFEIRTGIPCPSCGYTTAVSYFAHGNVIASLYTQPMGFVIAAIAAATVWVGAYIAVTGRPVHKLVAMLPSRALLMTLLGIAIAGWAWKIWIHVSGRDFWGVR